MVAAGCPQPPSAALLVRPDGYVAWAAAPDESSGQVRDGLRRALSGWFGGSDSGATPTGRMRPNQ